ncbi:ATP-binding cassette sub-family C member 5 isoform X2 [Halyomorpha halys]|uniref:ATP-binding cassette sub-family C member 5 isoform X2 n=1 Tax=Halyomorpha halys TaxID=286706 RepID=UPI0006D5031E|nr:multidrug resistance-associated protein 5-like isoform X2 [Halyomorpha halys]
MADKGVLESLDPEGSKEEDEPSYFKSNNNNASYHYAPRHGMSRYNTAFKNLIPFRKKKKNSKILGIDEAGLWQFVTYGWLTKYMTQAYKKGLTTDDIPNPCPQDSCAYNTQRLEALWQEELTRKGPESASLSWVTWRFMRTRFIFTSFLFIVCVFIGFVSVVFFMRYLLEYAESDEQSFLIGFQWASLFVLGALSRNVLYPIAWTTNYRTATRIRAGCLGMLFNKIMRLHHFGDKSIGELINIFSNDGQRFHDVVLFGPMIATGPISLALGIGYIYWLLGPWPILGLGSMFLFYPLQYFLSRLSGFFKRKVFSLTDKRLTVLSEILNSIKFIKLYSWAMIYINKITEIRKKELSLLHKVSYCNSFALSLSSNAPVIAGILTLLIHILITGTLTVSQAFTVLTLYNKLLRRVLLFTQEAFRSIIDFNLALQRLKGIMLLNEHTTVLSKPVDKSQSVCIADGTFAYYISSNNINVAKTKKGKIITEQKTTDSKREDGNETDLLNHTEQGTLNSNYKEILFDINFFAPQRSLIGVCGPVGSGKTSFLAAILGHLYMTKGKLCREGSCAYVSQQPWLVNATVRENILFGEKFIARKYYDVIQCCDLGVDIDSLPGGDHTEVGERGVNLSGGQKQRISLARALYSNRDIYLLDDPLSAVDSEVANHIFDKTILKALKSKTVIFVSHQVQFLNQCDEVVIMKEGRIVERGTPSDLSERESHYKLIIESLSKMDLEAQDEENKETKSTNNKKKHTDNERKTPKVAAKQDGVLIKEEIKEKGEIELSTFLSYISACGGWFFFFSLIIAMLLNIGSLAFSSWWLQEWIKAGSGNVTYSDANNQTVLSDRISDNPDYEMYQNVYFYTILAILASNFIRGFIFTKVTLRASTKFHNNLMDKLMKAYLSFFESTPGGRIQNLFAKDIDEVENKLPMTLENLIQGLLNASFSLLFICLAFPLFAVFFLVLFLIYYFKIHRTFRSGLRELKRLDNLTRSPVFTNVSTVVQGLDSIHAFGKEQGFIQRFISSFDFNSVCYYMSNVANRWIAIRVDTVSVFILFCVTMCAISMKGTLPASLAGLAITYASDLSGMLQYTLCLITDTEVKLISVERINSYLNILKAKEEGGHGPKGLPKENWPDQGTIQFCKVELKYKDDGDPVLKGISFHIKSEEKIGIIGRTGAGKSSIVTALFRLVEISNGNVIIDDLDTANLNLNELRQRLSIIPQDPVLFSGTIRSNLDPLEKYKDEEIWSALEKTSLKERVMMTDNKLHSKVEFNGSNLSTGEKQLLCLARALLKNSKILVLDEATSGLDFETEKIIQINQF